MNASSGSSRRRYLTVLGVAVVSFALGWFVGPGASVPGFPELGRLRTVTKKRCDKVGMSLSKLGVFSEDSLRYSPGDSARESVLVFRRTRGDAQLLELGAGHEDDEVDAEGQAFKLRWDEAKGWQVTDCLSLLRYQPGRP